MITRDISGLKAKLVNSDEDLNSREHANWAKAAEKYLMRRRPSNRSAPFTSKWMCRVHKEMLGDVWRWAGKVRADTTNFGVPVYNIGASLLDLEGDMRLWDGDAMEDATLLHMRAVRIHPFQDGNGRWARLLANIWLRKKRRPIVDWPATIRDSMSELRAEYIEVIGNEDLDGLNAIQRRFLSPSPSSPIVLMPLFAQSPDVVRP